MEEQLDEIEEGKLNWRNALRDFYDKFSVDLKNAEERIKNQKESFDSDRRNLRKMRFAEWSSNSDASDNFWLARIIPNVKRRAKSEVRKQTPATANAGRRRGE